MELTYYGDAISKFYDEMYPPNDAPDFVAYVQRILPPSSTVVDFGVGTGRTAIPLAHSGYRVHGIDVSEAMLDVLAQKDPEELVSTSRMDFIEAERGDYDLCVILNSTIYMADGSDRRGAVFAAAARQLRPGGVLLVESYSPLLYLRDGDTQHSFAPLGAAGAYFDKVLVDGYAQRLVIFRTFVTPQGVSTMVEESNFALLGELDLQATTAGFELISRTSDWRGAPASAQSPSFISQYRKS
ncbi:class I SAM-dependent methyltransferase [Microbacterium sp. F2E]|uniref:class I SAM-dependent methyltransferase n=1 Tax=Microbacterium sp. F2E TaxID=2895284 RepID=UPI001E38014F|nr:class I SAM-dependent methyltransferase [Microbacterium sp. F2E]MCC9053529.1 class I SAM-dependent methyltransferase [Microbacterium sp. F2E]